MADNEVTETKEKRTVPAMVRTARGVADHAAAVLEMQWDKERKSFKDPITATMALFTYAKLTAALLDEAEARINARETALEVRTEKLEQQIAAFESWRADAEKQGATMAKEFEEMVRNVESPEDITRLVMKRVGQGEGAAKAAIDTSTVDVVGENDSVVPLKPAKTENKQRGEKGGAA